jgi:hypothetical protein
MGPKVGATSAVVSSDAPPTAYDRGASVRLQEQTASTGILGLRPSTKRVGRPDASWRSAGRGRLIEYSMKGAPEFAQVLDGSVTQAHIGA